MTEESVEYLEPGQPWSADAVCDPTKELSWAKLSDEETREVVDGSGTWRLTLSPEHIRPRLNPETDIIYLAEKDDDRETNYPIWLTYDGLFRGSYVNPVQHLRDWRPHVARFIHGYQLVQETETFRGLSADTKAEVRRLVHGICGTAWFRLDLWEAGKSNNYENWGNYTEWVKIAIDAVCTECDSETAARLIGTNINTSEFAAKHNAGQVWTTDRISKPWIPGVKLHELNPDTATPESISSFFEGLKTRAHRALDYYDEIVSKTLIPHSHDT